MILSSAKRRWLLGWICASLLILSELLPGQIQYGAASAVTLSRMWGLEARDRDWKPGALFGIFGAIPVAENLALRLEVNFSMKGYHYTYREDGDIPGNKVHAYLDLNYIEMPILLQFAVPIGPELSPLDEPLVPEIFVGFAPGYNIGATARARIGDSKTSGSVDNIRALDISAMLGASVELPKNFYLQLRASAGLLPVIDVQYPPKRYNLCGAAGLEYRLPVKQGK